MFGNSEYYFFVLETNGGGSSNGYGGGTGNGSNTGNPRLEL